MKFRRRGYSEPIPPSTPSPRGEYLWGANGTVNTPDGIGELDGDVYTNDITVTVLFDLETKTYPIGQVSRVKRSR